MPEATYKTATYWQQYQPFFPEDVRISADNAPAEEWFAWRGASIHLDRFSSPSSPLTIIVVHGGGGYGRMFAPLGRLLHEAGYDVIAPDLPGYGLTQADASMIDYATWVDILCDLAADEYRRRGRRVVFFGGSLGGYLAYLCAARMGKEIIAGVMATTLADPRSPLVRRQFARNALVLHGMMPLMPWCAALFGKLRLPVKWFTKMHAMSNDPALNRLVANDPFGGGAHVPVRFMQSIFTVRPLVEPEDFDICPVLLVHPANDRWTGVASSRPFFDRIKGEKTLVMLENCGHFPVEEPGITQLRLAALGFLSKVAG
ncbi:lysophospholipase [Herbaspirillum sp. meg3]|uniref:alpha/beta hydrolase n=1 Tax=Herbaspirillum sp. meg3 TaxID=2025949 RepID=UPI000B98E9F3|nr:alpha/beta hydrolase [Herbaspirillum sp. meg3]ASU38726.1 lysophospholipase [Herbaspirillum sp. meg3]